MILLKIELNLISFLHVKIKLSAMKRETPPPVLLGRILYSWEYPFIKKQSTLCGIGEVLVSPIIGKVSSKSLRRNLNLSKFLDTPLMLAFSIEN